MTIEIILILAFILVIIATIVFLAIRGKKDIIYKMLYAFVNEAEEMYGSKTGKIKFAYVIEKIYSILPAFFKLFITYETLEKWTEKALSEAKEYWAERAGISEEAPQVTVFAQDN